MNRRTAPLAAVALLLAVPLLALLITLAAGPADADGFEADAYVLDRCSGERAADCRDAVMMFRAAVPKALQGDYQAQRNVAYCLFTGCHGAVRKHPATACAWRIVLLGSAHFRADSGDVSNWRNECGRLDRLTWQTAAGQASRLVGLMGAAGVDAYKASEPFLTQPSR